MSTVLLASSTWHVEALPGPEESTVVTIDPERILDTRDGNDIGLVGPFVSATPQKLQVTGMVETADGTKTVVPSGATGVLLNVTVVSPTASGFVSVRPGNAGGAPTTSSLNFTIGQVVPNAVQVVLPTSGANAGMIEISYNAFGVIGPTTDILVDVVGYFTADGLQDLVMSLPIAASARSDDVIEPADASSNFIALSVEIEVPKAGLLQIVGSVFIRTGGSNAVHDCELTLGAGVASNDGTLLADTDRRSYVDSTTLGTCATNGAVGVAAGTHVVNLVLAGPDQDSAYDDVTPRSPWG